MTAELQAATPPATAPPATAPATLPITESQKGLLVVDSMVPTKEIYNQVAQFDIDPARCAAPLADSAVRAMIALVTVQPALRQVFGSQPEMRAALLEPPTAADLPLEAVTVPPTEYATALAQLSGTIGRTPFDLATGPAYRFGFVRAADDSAAAILLCAHHIVGDGVSMGPLVRDLDQVLTGDVDVAGLRAARETAFAKELRAQNRSAERTGERVTEWAKRLRQVPPLVLYPRPDRPDRTDFAGTRISWSLDEAETGLLNATCKRLGITPFVLFTGVYGAVLARHGGVAEVLVGSPFTARRTIGAYELCGFFVNTLPVTVDVDWTRTVDEHLGTSTRAAVDRCRSNVDVPFNQLVAQVQPDRPSDRNPLFSCMLAMQDTFDPAEATGAVTGLREPGNGTAKFDLWLGATREPHGWLLELEYDRALIPPAVADGLLNSLRTALRRALRDGSSALADLFDDASEVLSRRHDGYPTPVPAPTLSEWFDQAAGRTPAAVAIEEPGRTLTFAELSAAARRLAARLTGLGVGPGDVVGLRPGSLGDAATAILAILRRGAAYLPLEPGLPADRLSYMVRQSGCRIVLGTAPDIAGVRTAPIAAVTDESDADVETAATADSAVYVMFTSGSTGLPKGVSMGHAPLLNLVAWQIGALGMTADSRFLQYAPAGFDVSFQEIMPTLLAGGAVVAREPADRRDLPAVVRRVAETAVTHLYLPVAALRPFVQSARELRAQLPALRQLCVSGEQLLVDGEIREFFTEHPHCALVNHYGPTETQAVTTWRLAADDPPWPGHVPIGRPLPNVAAYVVDVTGHLAPAGVPGELLLGGCAPADGYVNDPERTAERFQPDRFGAGGMLYRTGDQVVRDEHGVLVFLGRHDTQVKVRGHRVELGELEIAAGGLPGVRQAVAAVRGDAADRELLLFLVPGPGAAPDHDAVRGALERRLPSYMVPARIIGVDSVPTTASGKTDRAALVEIGERVIARRAEQSDAPITEYADELERDLARMWAEVLQVPVIEPDRPVLQYGAHSLNIFAVLGQVQQRYGVALQLVDFFRTPTVTNLATLVRQGEAEA